MSGALLPAAACSVTVQSCIQVLHYCGRILHIHNFVSSWRSPSSLLFCFVCQSNDVAGHKLLIQCAPYTLPPSAPTGAASMGGGAIAANVSSAFWRELPAAALRKTVVPVTYQKQQPPTGGVGFATPEVYTHPSSSVCHVSCSPCCLYVMLSVVVRGCLLSHLLSATYSRT